MGFIREPQGVDFVIQSEPLTEKDRMEISKYIKEYKAKYSLKTGSGSKRKSVSKAKKTSV